MTVKVQFRQGSEGHFWEELGGGELLITDLEFRGEAVRAHELC